MGNGFAQAWILPEIGFFQAGQADGAARRCVLQRADVEISELIRRENGKPSPAGDNAGDIVIVVVVRLGAGLVADPDIRCDERRQDRVDVFEGKARKVLGNRRRLNVDIRRVRVVQKAEQLVDAGAYRARPAIEIEVVHVGAVCESPFDNATGFEDARRAAGIHRLQIGADGLRRGFSLSDGWPICHKPFEKNRPRLGQDIPDEHLGCYIGKNVDGWDGKFFKHEDQPVRL